MKAVRLITPYEVVGGFLKDFGYLAVALRTVTDPTSDIFERFERCADVLTTSILIHADPNEFQERAIAAVHHFKGQGELIRRKLVEERNAASSPCGSLSTPDRVLG